MIEKEGLNEYIESHLEEYSALFDSYLNTGVLPYDMQRDVLANYLKTVLDDPGIKYQCQTDEIWKDLMKTSLLEFFRVLLPYYFEIEQTAKKERKYMDAFFSGDIDRKRAMWHDVEEYIESLYPPEQMNMEGYDQLFRNTDKDRNAIFDCLEDEWDNALSRSVKEQQEELLKANKGSFERSTTRLSGTEDYKRVKRLGNYSYHYPVITKIAHIIGREKETEENNERDETVTHYIPLLLSHSPIRESIDGVVSGNDLSAILPTEIAMLSHHDSERVFYQRYATKQLQLFSGKSPLITKKKTEVHKKKEQRLSEGPIVVSIDTSGSMEGERERISKAMLLQLLDIAKRKKRKCFLITFSVRARTLEITHTRHWYAVQKFLSEHFTGGTDGECMLNLALEALETKDFSMADVLIISDFQFPYPSKRTVEAIHAAQGMGTKFYGLRMFDEDYEYKYNQLFDRMWVV